MDSPTIRWLREPGPWAVLDLLDGVSCGHCMTGRVKSYCSVVVRFSSLLYSALRVSLDRGDTTLRMQCILDFHRSREHSLAVRRNTDLLPQRQIGRPLPLNTDIPDHCSFQQYAKSKFRGLLV